MEEAIQEAQHKLQYDTVLHSSLLDYLDGVAVDCDIDYLEFIENERIEDEAIPHCGSMTFGKLDLEVMREFLVSEWYDRQHELKYERE